MKQLIAILTIVCLTLITACLPSNNDEQTLKIATLKFGTVSWELETIKKLGLDQKEKLNLEISGVAGHAAARVAFLGGQADVIVEDWLWVARQRAAGHDYVFIPYSSAVGSIVVPNNSPIESIADLAGKKIGIAGGPLDKNWLILRAYSKTQFGIDLLEVTEQVYAAPPLIYRSALGNDIDAAVNFWHYSARAQAAGMRPLIPVRQAAESLGLDAHSPLLGYVVRESLIQERPETVLGLIRASKAAKKILKNDDDIWNQIRPIMKVENNAQFESLKQGFRDGLPGPVNLKATENMLEIMVDMAGAKAVGVTKLPKGMFYAPNLD